MTHFRNKKTGEVWVQERFGPPYVSTPVVIGIVVGLLVGGCLLAFFGPATAPPAHHLSAPQPVTQQPTGSR